MMRMVRVFALIILTALLTACGVDPAGDATALSDHIALSTQVIEARGTATHAADERAVTLEYLATASTLAAQRQRQILLTLTRSGVDTSRVMDITPRATPTNAAMDAAATLAISGPDVAGGVTRLPSTPQFRTAVPTNTSVAPTATIDPNGPIFTEPMTALGVDSDDCALEPTFSFTAQTPEIYVVAVANNVQPGMVLASRWYKDGVELAVFDFQPDFAIDDNCVWFYATSEDFPFDAGAYSVQLEIDGRMAAPPVTFTIAGETAPPSTEIQP